MNNRERTLDFSNLQTQNLLDLELHELRPILYPKLMHLMETEKLDQLKNLPIKEQTKRNQSLEEIYIDENLIIKNRVAISRSLLDDRCIAILCSESLFKVCSKFGESLLKELRYRFFKQIRYSGKDYSKKLFNALLDHSLASGKTIIIDKNIKLERVGQNTQWKIDFTNFLTQNCKSSYEWLNHIRISKLRELGLLTLRNHLNQQMIKQHRSEINNRLQQQVQKHLDKDQQTKKKRSDRGQDGRIVGNLQNLEKSNKQINVREVVDEIDFSIFYSDEPQLNQTEQKLQNVINELSCLQSSKYANQMLDFRDTTQSQTRTFYRADNDISMPKTYQLTNEFESNVIQRSKRLDMNEIRDILEEERMYNLDQDESDEDEMAVTMPNYKQKKNQKNKKWPRLKRWKRRLRRNIRFVQLRCVRFLRKQTYNILIRYEEIQNHPIIIEQLNVFGHELSSALPANVPYCQIGKSSLIAALKQFNWSHTQGPFLIND